MRFLADTSYGCRYDDGVAAHVVSQPAKSPYDRSIRDDRIWLSVGCYRELRLRCA